MPSLTESSKTMMLEGTRRCLETYGADTAKWPEEMRRRYGDLVMSDELAGVRYDAASLDGFLGAATAPRMSIDLKSRIKVQYEAPVGTGDFFAEVTELFSRFRLLPAGALAGVGALGLATGIMTTSQAELPPEYEAYVYADQAMMSALVGEEEMDLWAVD